MSDLLTGLNSRHQLHLILPELCLKANLAKPLCLLLLQVKNFDLWQGKLSPMAADKLLKISADFLADNQPKLSYLARFSGATFALAINECQSWQALDLAEQLCLTAQNHALPAVFDYEGISLNFDYGLATLPPQDIWQLTAAAEKDLKKAKGGAFTALGSNNLLCEQTVLIKMAHAIIKQNSPYLWQHGLLSSNLALACGAKLGFDKDQLTDLEMAVNLADIALSEVGGQILDKPGVLTAAEWRRIQSHSEFAAKFCHSFGLNDTICQAVLHHHERYDGCGYPEGLKQDQIPIMAAIVGACNCYAALLLPRPYRPARKSIIAKAEFARLHGKAYSPAVSQCLLEMDHIIRGIKTV